jgi:hypothetical protein
VHSSSLIVDAHGDKLLKAKLNQNTPTPQSDYALIHLPEHDVYNVGDIDQK